MTLYRFERFTTSIAQIWRSLQKLKTRTMETFGLKSSHVMCLFFLLHAKDGLTAAELSECSELDKGAVSRASAELEARGYVVCKQQGEKRRYRAKLLLTESGREVAGRLDRIIEETVEKAGDGLTEEERTIFYKGLTLSAVNLQALSEE